MNTNKYKISIIVPVFNLEKCLSRCLNSIINQTHSNLEIIVISDGSTDKSNEIIRDFANEDSRIIPIFKENTGVSDTRNRGLDIATGDYIGFVDGDDFIEPDMYEVLLKNALDNDADISHCVYQMVFPSKVDYYYNTCNRMIQDNKSGIFDLLSGKVVEPSLCNKLYKRSLINDTQLDKKYKYNEDLLFNFQAFIKSKLSFFDDRTFYHAVLRKDSATHMSINDNMLFDPIKVRREIFDYCCKNLDFEIQSLAYSKYLGSVIGLYRTLKFNKITDKNESAKRYKDEIKNIKVKFSLSRRMKIEKFLFFHFTSIHMFIYSFYDKHISKNRNKYEVK